MLLSFTILNLHRFSNLNTDHVKFSYKILFAYKNLLSDYNIIMSKVSLNLIAAACQNMGIGANGTLPWRLKKEMVYFNSMTTKVKDSTKINAVIMGRKTWDSIPGKYRPLNNRVNIVITRQVDTVKKEAPNDVVILPGLDEAISYINGREDIESTWVIGGSVIYKAAMEHPNCDKIYLTEILKTFECDTFFPNIDKQLFQLVDEDGIQKDRQTEGDIDYYFRVYKRKTLEEVC